MSIAKRSDPITAFNFQISLVESGGSIAEAVTTITLSSLNLSKPTGFSECSGLEGSLEVEEYTPGGVNGGALKFPSRNTWPVITLKRGLTTSTDLWDWFYGFVEGNGKRRDGVITLLDSNRQPRTVWRFRNGLPTKFSGPSLNATQNAVAIETIEITHEGLYQMGGATGLSSVIESVVGLFS